MGLFSLGQAQNVTISGKITDAADQSPIIGANIIEKDNPANGATTDFDGQYSLTVSANAIIVFSYLGYVTQELDAGTEDRMADIALAQDVEILEEMVVVGYSSKRKSAIN